MESCGLSYLETVARPKVLHRGGRGTVAGGRWDSRYGGGRGGGQWKTGTRSAAPSHGVSGGKSNVEEEEQATTTLELDPPLDELLAFGCSLHDQGSSAERGFVGEITKIQHTVRSPQFRQLIYLEQRKLSILLHAKRLQQDGEGAKLSSCDVAVSASAADGIRTTTDTLPLKPGLASQAVAAAGES